jgi:hypothetical protein
MIHTLAFINTLTYTDTRIVYNTFRKYKIDGERGRLEVIYFLKKDNIGYVYFPKYKCME